MNTKKATAPHARGTAATTRTSPTQGADQVDCNTTNRWGKHQFEIRYDDETLTTAQRFEAFHQANPIVYRHLVQFSREIVAAGHKPSIRLIWERLRWELLTSTNTHDYKLNDHYTSFYARMIDSQEPDLRGLFELRHSPEADQWASKRVSS